MSARKDHTGERFGSLVVVSFTRIPPRTDAYWICRCDCGGETTTTGNKLRSGHTRSCGCLSRSVGKTRQTRHGMTGTPTYNTWGEMMTRCNNPRRKRWANYGGRGICVCDRWHLFENFLADMGERPSPSHSLDRIDNDGHYEPGNVRWATAREQQNNRSNNHRIEHDGETRTLSEWSAETGLPYGALYRRVERGSCVEVVFRPLEDHRRPLTLNGETLTLSDWARRTGISVGGLRRRLNSGWPLEKALTTPAAAQTSLITYQGQTHTLTEWARRLGIAPCTVKRRLALGWPLDRVLSHVDHRHQPAWNRKKPLG